MNDVLAAWRDRIKEAASARTPLRLVGGGTKDFYGQELVGERFDTTTYAGVVDYDPTELVITVRCGTPLAEVERTLAERGQMLGFEPPRFGDAATLGGCIAAGLAGPRRPYAGAIRDLVLGVRLIDGRGEDLSFGGRVMKNVAGFDVSRVLAGSLGTLGIILEASIKCLPLPKLEASHVLELTADQAIRRMNEWGGRPLPLTATCYCNGLLHARFAGADVTVHVRKDTLGQVVCLDAVVDDEFFDAGRQPEITADHAPYEPFMRKPVESSVLHVALPRGEHQCQSTRRPGFEKALLQCDKELVGRAIASVAGRSHDIAVVDHRNGIRSFHDLLEPHEFSSMTRLTGPQR